MKYLKLSASLAVLCLMTGFALAAQSGNGPSANAGNCNGNCIISCPNEGTCTGENCQAGENCQNKGGNGNGAQDGTGPLGDEYRDRDRDQTCQE